jgi:hypothetical protein
MRITFLGNFQVPFSSETHHKISLESLGHYVIPLQETQAGSEQIMREALQSDIFVWVHTHGWNTPGERSMASVLNILRDKSIPTLTYHLDLWFGLNRQAELEADDIYKHIQHFFTVDKKMADWFNENGNGVQGHYLPAGVLGQECFIDENIQKVNDVVFVGSRNYHPEWPYRPTLVNWLQQTYGNRFIHVGGDGIGIVRGHELIGLYNATKVAVGDSLCVDFIYPYYWSDRVYETMGRGGFLIMPYIKGLEDEFKLWGDDKELVTYPFGDFERLKEVIDHALVNDKEREAIRIRGHNKVKNNYTYKHRWQTILTEIGK